jgi:hypothetical protein
VSAASDPASSRPTLKLFSADQLDAADADHVSGLSALLTLSEFARDFVIPIWLKSRQASPLTVDGYECSLDYWRKLTGDPPLCLIDDAATAQFVAGLFDQPGRKSEKMSAANVHKHCRNIRTCLNLAGPKTRVYERARGMIEYPPKIDMPQLEEDDVEDNFELPELEAIVKACPHMDRPKQALTTIPPPHFWLSLVAVIYNTGERKGAIFKVKQPAPDDELLHFPAVTRKGKRKGRKVPLNQYAREAIEAIRTERELLFPWPHCPRHFYTLWWRLLTYAGIPEERHFGLHGLRKATATEISAYSPMGAQLVMGHSDGTLLQKHYVNRRIERDALARLPQPTTWRIDDRQLDLF